MFLRVRTQLSLHRSPVRQQSRMDIKDTAKGVAVSKGQIHRPHDPPAREPDDHSATDISILGGPHGRCSLRRRDRPGCLQSAPHQTSRSSPTSVRPGSPREVRSRHASALQRLRARRQRDTKGPGLLQHRVRQGYGSRLQARSESALRIPQRQGDDRIRLSAIHSHVHQPQQERLLA